MFEKFREVVGSYDYVSDDEHCVVRLDALGFVGGISVFDTAPGFDEGDR